VVREPITNTHNAVTKRTVDTINVADITTAAAKLHGNPALVLLRNALGIFFRNAGIVPGGPVGPREPGHTLPMPYDNLVRFKSACWIDQPFAAKRWRLISSASWHGKGARRDDADVWDGEGVSSVKVHLLFTCFPPIEAAAVSSKQLQLAFVQWYEERTASQVFGTFPRLELTKNFDVVEVESFVSQQWMMRDRASPGRAFYHRNVFVTKMLQAKNDLALDGENGSENGSESGSENGSESGSESDDDALPALQGSFLDLDLGETDSEDELWVAPVARERVRRGQRVPESEEEA
jgi:hypothetical protein